MHKPKKSDWGLIEGKFVNTSESTSRLVHTTVQIYSFVRSSCVTEETNLQTVKGKYLPTIYAELA